MALNDDNFPINFSQGLDTKTDPKQVSAGKMLVMQNCSFKSPKQIQKRDGFQGLTQNVVPSGSISNGVGIAAFQNELNVMDGSKLYSYSPDCGGHLPKGTMVPLNLSVSPVVGNTYSQTSPDSAYHAGTGL